MRQALRCVSAKYEAVKATEREEWLRARHAVAVVAPSHRCERSQPKSAVDSVRLDKCAS